MNMNFPAMILNSHGFGLESLECGCGTRECEWCSKIWELMDAVMNTYRCQIEMDKPFLMPVEDVFTIAGRVL